MNTQSKYIPGPWIPTEMNPDNPSLDAWRISTNDETISLHVAGKANAHLIAAAPDLLSACHQALAAMETHLTLRSYSYGPEKDALREAITKAEHPTPD